MIGRSLTRTGRRLGRHDGPVFISYRQSDGTGIANFVETYLRCGGIIPWRDLADLPAGEVARSVQEAMEDGISAGILIVTPELGNSAFVRDHEVPILLEMQRSDPRRFRLYVINTIRDAAGGKRFDVGAPDRLLKFTAEARTSPRRRRIEKGLLTRKRAADHLLQNAKQYALLEQTRDASAVSELEKLLRDLLRHRLRARRPNLLDREVKIAVQTRPEPSSEEATRGARRSADLTIRMRQDPRTQIPAELDYRCLRETLPILIDSIHNKGINKVTFSGGCHPSIAWALGASLPDARGLKEFSWQDAYDPEQVWSSQSNKPVSSSIHMKVGEAEAVPINLDRPPSAEELKTLLGNADPSLGIVVHLSTGRHHTEPVADLARHLGGAPIVVLDVVGPQAAAGRNAWVPPEEGEKLARLLGTVLRNLAKAGTEPLHLSFSGAVPLAALTARHCNTVAVQIYEFAHHTDGRPDGYVPVLTTVSGVKHPVTHVFEQGASDGGITHLVNLTPHAVTLYWEDEPIHVWERPGENTPWVRQGESRVPSAPLQVEGVEVPHTHVIPGSLTGLPTAEEGTGFIVSRISAAAARRGDFFFPDGEVRDGRNVVVGCRGLGSFPAHSDEVRPYLQWLPDREG
ncbi:SAVED domain-containing protein [Arachnia propionica]|uniref:SAVED domain-containing protein n=1 Tax=Arachnia propionica TaxID=1750 RepID=A0A3P1T6T5_9ACTN|nr:SAVED domain-containing protein [Arachnia propionica]RRD04536.1 SAVED domain-containing protein [Arachnia propionica]